MTIGTITDIICIIGMPLFAFLYYRLGLRVGKRRGYGEGYEEAKERCEAELNIAKLELENAKLALESANLERDFARIELERERALRIEAERKVKLLECELEEAYDVGYEEVESRGFLEEEWGILEGTSRSI